MWLSAENAAGNPNCLESATSALPAGHFTIVGEYCDTNLNDGDLDPSIYQDGNSAYLLFSKQGPNHYSVIAIATLSSDGTAINSNDSEYIIADIAHVKSALPYVNIGNNAQLENPQLDPDSAGTAPDGNPIAFDLYASFGSYRANGTYHTVEIACESIIGPCYDSNSTQVDNQMLAGEQGVMNPGGLCLAYSTSGEYALFAAPLTGTGPSSWMPRTLYFEPTTKAVGVYGPLTGLATQSGPYSPPAYAVST